MLSGSGGAPLTHVVIVKHFLFSLLFSCLLLLGGVAPARAQSPVDIRVSPPDADNYVMPPEVRIQASGRIGPLDLVVWCTTYNPIPDSLATTLRMQLLRDGLTVGAQATLTSPAARPYGYVRVIPMSDRFLVVWNDRRVGAEGLYARCVGRDGSPIGIERLLSPNPTMTYPPIQMLTVVGEPARGIALCWLGLGANSAYYALRIDPSGNPDGVPRRLGARLEQMLTYDELPGLVLVRVDSGGGRIIYDDGRIDPRPIPKGRLSQQFYVGADTSLVTTSGHDMVCYANIHEAVPVRMVPVPAIDSAYHGLALVARDTGEGYTIQFPVVRITGGLTGIVWPDEMRRTMIYRMRVDALGAVIGPDLILADSAINSAVPTEPVFEDGGASVSIGCSNSARLDVWFTVTTFYHGQAVTPQGRADLFFSLNGRGIVRLDKGGASGYIATCLANPLQTVVRTSYERTSTVRERSITGDVSLSAPTGHVGVDLAQSRPGIMLDGDTLRVAWHHSPRASALARWTSILDTPVVTDWLVPDTVSRAEPSFGERMTDLYTGVNSVDDSLEVFQDIAAIVVHRERYDDITWWYSPISPNNYHPVTSFGMSTYLARHGSWTMVTNMLTRKDGDWTHSYTGAYAGYPSYLIGYEPNRHQVLCRVQDIFTNRDSLVSIMPDGRRAWGVTARTLRGAIVPVDSATYLRIDSATAWSMLGDSVVGMFPLSPGDPSATYQRLLGRRFLRCASSADSIVLEEWDLDGGPIGRGAIAIDSLTGVPRIVENPADSSIIILFVDHGVRAAHFSAMLARRDSTRRVSAAEARVSLPSGVVRHDTLFVVWQDARNRQPDIYGNRLSLARLVEPRDTVIEEHPVDPPDTVEHQIDTTSRGNSMIVEGLIRPNPARDLLRIDARLSEEVIIEVFDDIGRLVKRERMAVTRPGPGTVEIVVDDLYPGAYTLRLSSGPSTVVGRFVHF